MTGDLRKSDLKILEKIFEQEIFGHIYHSKAKRLKWLEENGYISREELVFLGRFRGAVKGWGLTHRGRMAYCETCKDEREPEDD